MAHRVWATLQNIGAVEVQISPNGQDYAGCTPGWLTTLVPASGDTIHVKATDSLEDEATSGDPVLPTQGEALTGSHYIFLKSAQGQGQVTISEDDTQ